MYRSKTIFTSIFFLFITCSFSNDFIRLKKNITSKLNTTDLINFNDNLLVGTDGGAYIYDYNLNQSMDLNEDLRSFGVSTFSICPSSYLWVGSSVSGKLLIVDNDFNLYSYIEYPQFDRVHDIDFSNNYAFAIVTNNQEYMIAQYNIENMLNPYYVNLYSSFPLTFNKMNDIQVNGEMVYIATSSGLLTANLNDVMSFSANWNVSYEFEDIAVIRKYGERFIIVYDNNIIDIETNDVFVIDELSKIKNIYTAENYNEIIVVQNESLYIYNFLTQTLSSIDLPDNIDDDITSYLQIDNKLFCGIENRGLLFNQASLNEWYNYIPNTIYKNQFDALALNKYNDLIGVVNHKDDTGQSGGFIYRNPLSGIDNNNSINNFYSYNGFYINNFPLSTGEFKVSILNYWSGDNSVKSAVVDNQNRLYFSNSGTYPPAWLGHYENVAYNYLFELSEETAYGGVLEIEINLSNNSFDISSVYNLANNILGGNNGIFNSSWTNGFMTINQIVKDPHENIWIVNPFSERNNYPIAMKILNGWYHVQYDDNDGYIPQEMAIDKYNNLWIAYKFSETMDNSSVYSSGGVKMVELNNIYNQNDDQWHSSWLDDLKGTNVWSITFSNDEYGNQILWVMTDLGIIGYIVNITYTQSGNIVTEFVQIDDGYYFQGLSYQEGCKLRTDNDNNVWVTTKLDGLRIIRNNGQLLGGNMSTVDVEEIGILSNNIFDVVFDNYGYVYIATDMGISILETSFNKKTSLNNLSVSPNPFIIGEDNQIIVSNVPYDSKVKIMNLSGYVVKEFDMSESGGKYLNWAGRSDEGYTLSSGVYLLSVFNPDYGTGVTKLAVINK